MGAYLLSLVLDLPPAITAAPGCPSQLSNTSNSVSSCIPHNLVNNTNLLNLQVMHIPDSCALQSRCFAVPWSLLCSGVLLGSFDFVCDS